MRIGHGFDVHRFAARGADAGEGEHIVIGGVQIPHTRALLAHSDGDVLIHALCDALLGALALGDIGQHFPDTDPRFCDIDSRTLLRHVYGLVQSSGFQLGNADMTVVAEQPKMAPHIDAMRRHLASDLNSQVTHVGIKATTSEGLGYTGRGEGIACYAVVLLCAAES